jgi:hypothetical protein
MKRVLIQQRGRPVILRPPCGHHRKDRAMGRVAVLHLGAACVARSRPRGPDPDFIGPFGGVGETDSRDEARCADSVIPMAKRDLSSTAAPRSQEDACGRDPDLRRDEDSRGHWPLESSLAGAREMHVDFLEHAKLHSCSRRNPWSHAAAMLDPASRTRRSMSARARNAD